MIPAKIEVAMAYKHDIQDLRNAHTALRELQKQTSHILQVMDQRLQMIEGETGQNFHYVDKFGNRVQR